MPIEDTKENKGKQSRFTKFEKAKFEKDMNSFEKNGTLKSNQLVKNLCNA
jgi:hypothetical protein